ncbi:MAG: hypothetical protein AXW15_11355 [Neptuniibacter sp. Phe_28]|nr:MAG: hypothetical protein AXW15_11355 [Neptuniibacter sp. Phe_28]
MEHNTSLLSKFFAYLSYLFSGGLIAGDMMNFLNENYGAVGSCVAIATLLITWHYKRKEIKILERNLK